MEFSLFELQQKVGGEIHGEPQTMISGVNDLKAAHENEIAFAENPGYFEQARHSKAAALVVPNDFPDLDKQNLLRIDSPRETFVRIMMLFDNEPPAPGGIHPTSVIAANSVGIAEEVSIGEHTVIREDVTIGKHTRIESGVHIGQGVKIGEQCVIGPNVVIKNNASIGNRVTIHAGTTIGSDGFGYVWSDDRHQKIPHFGNVQIGDDVEIGCNVCIDRATFGVTLIGCGTKIDNLVHIAHNCEIGENSILVSQVGLSGSVRVGNRVTLAGQVGVADHVRIEDGAVALARTGVSKDIKSGQVVWGAPSRPKAQVLRELASLASLPRLVKQVRELATRLAQLENQLEDGSSNTAR
jgi:UDP-3-O-[3-hydroxymyristoyl] glucosamine N-acyltransferase